MTKKLLVQDFLTFETWNLSCYENGGWSGLKVEPNIGNSYYPVDEENKRWNIKSISWGKKPEVCESLRVKNNGEGWSLNSGIGSAQWCTIYKKITSPEEEADTIRGINCSWTGSSKTSEERPNVLPRRSREKQRSLFQKRSKSVSLRRKPKESKGVWPLEFPKRHHMEKPDIFANRTLVTLEEKFNSTFPTSTPTGPNKPSHLVLTVADMRIVIGLSVVLLFSFFMVIRKSSPMVKIARTINYYVPFLRTPDVSLIKSKDSKDATHISDHDHSSNTNSSRYLHPFSKNSVVLSEKEYLPLCEEEQKVFSK